MYHVLIYTIPDCVEYIHTHLLAGAIALLNAPYGLGTGPILLDSVRCSTGNETSLLKCSYVGVRNHDCSHYHDAGVLCPGKVC